MSTAFRGRDLLDALGSKPPFTFSTKLGLLHVNASYQCVYVANLVPFNPIDGHSPSEFGRCIGASVEFLPLHGLSLPIRLFYWIEIGLSTAPLLSKRRVKGDPCAHPTRPTYMGVNQGYPDLLKDKKDGGAIWPNATCNPRGTTSRYLLQSEILLQDNVFQVNDLSRRESLPLPLIDSSSETAG
ncbi:hypothetical protein BGZ63DRAFT_421259 [Mariannaea sp. PMI_226]|nr:hypothetical protein BGZ63DRAFT_421259 [Mariannaea sp. PMI_226]